MTRISYILSLVKWQYSLNSLSAQRPVREQIEANLGTYTHSRAQRWDICIDYGMEFLWDSSALRSLNSLHAFPSGQKIELSIV